MSSIEIAPERLLLLFGLAFFFGLAFEEFNARTQEPRPGGVRTFPILAFIGAGLYLLEPHTALAFTGGLVILGGFLIAYYVRHLGDPVEPGGTHVGIMAPSCNLLAFLLGPVALVAPAWVAVSMTVAAVLLLGSRERLHGLAQRIAEEEIVTAGKFLILTGIILPLVPNEPVTRLTPITPYQLWLAVVAVSTLSYGSYLVQRYLWPRRGICLAAALGGLYSSTATTVTLARRAGTELGARGELQGGIVLATGMMYLRLGIVIAIFNPSLARALALPALALFILALAMAMLCRALAMRGDAAKPSEHAPANPLELSAALLFAAIFIVVSLASGWVRSAFGEGGLFSFAAIVGVADIDPFVLSLAQGGGNQPLADLATAALIAVASNNVLKAIYGVAFAGWRIGAMPAAALLLLAFASLGAAWLVR